MNAQDESTEKRLQHGEDDISEKDTERNLSTIDPTSADPMLGGIMGLFGGAVVGAAAGGPLGAVIGGVAGAIAGDVAIEGIERMTYDATVKEKLAAEDEDRFTNEGASTPSFDAETGVTDHDYTVGDINATDHTIFGSNGNEIVDEADAPAPGYRSTNPKS
jgi:hypothetical protein